MLFPPKPSKVFEAVLFPILGICDAVEVGNDAIVPCDEAGFGNVDMADSKDTSSVVEGGAFKDVCAEQHIKLTYNIIQRVEAYRRVI